MNRESVSESQYSNFTNRKTITQSSPIKEDSLIIESIMAENGVENIVKTTMEQFGVDEKDLVVSKTSQQFKTEDLNKKIMCLALALDTDKFVYVNNLNVLVEVDYQ